MKNPVTIYIADDHQMTIDGLKLLISGEASLKVIGSANDGAAACEDIVLKRPDLALIDKRMPKMNGLEVIYSLRKTVPDTKFIILSTDGDQHYIRDAMSGGAQGYLVKNAGQEELIKCLLTVAGGGRYFPDLRTGRDNSNKPLFTPKEKLIIKFILEEYTSVQIAAELSLSLHTVDAHRKNICHKAKTKTALGLSRFLLEHKIDL